MVPVLLRNGRGSCGIRQIPLRLCEAHLAERVTEVGFRPRHVRSQREGFRQPGSCQHRDPQPTAGGSAWPKARRSTTIWKGGWPPRRSFPWLALPSKVMRMGRHIRTAAPTPINPRAKYAHRTIKGGVGHNLPQEAPQAFAEAVLDVDALVFRDTNSVNGKLKQGERSSRKPTTVERQSYVSQISVAALFRSL